VSTATDERVIEEEWLWWSLMQLYPKPPGRVKGLTAYREAHVEWERVLVEVRRRGLFDRLRWS
jgi:hypothetical protein